MNWQKASLWKKYFETNDYDTYNWSKREFSMFLQEVERMNADYTQEELEQAIKAFKSSIGKCEKARVKLKDGSPQKKWVDRQLEAFYIALSLIKNLTDEKHHNNAGQYVKSELQNAGETCKLLIGKCEKLLPKFKDGTPQKTLAVRRLRAFHIAAALITRELEAVYAKETP
jgi:DNA-binding XRE family transcriptional regulator